MWKCGSIFVSNESRSVDSSLSQTFNRELVIHDTESRFQMYSSTSCMINVMVDIEKNMQKEKHQNLFGILNLLTVFSFFLLFPLVFYNLCNVFHGHIWIEQHCDSFSSNKCKINKLFIERSCYICNIFVIFSCMLEVPIYLRMFLFSLYCNRFLFPKTSR